MSTSFFIDLEGVRRVAGSIGQTADELATSKNLGDVALISSSDDKYGQLRDHVSSFFHDWSDGMTKISGHLKDIQGVLENAVGAYSTTEDHIVAAATPHDPGSGGSGW